MIDRPIPESRAACIRQCAAELFASGLLDCDNTLLDNDLVEDDLRDCLAVEIRSESRDRYWAIFKQLGGQTLRNHLHHINRKLHTHTRLEAVTHAQRRGLIE